MTTAGVGFSKVDDSFQSGAEAARQALDEAGGGTPVAAIVFTTTSHDAAKLREGIRSVIGHDARIVGGYSMGVITHKALSYAGGETGVAVVCSDDVKAEVFSQEGLIGNEHAIGSQLGAQIKGKEYQGAPNLLLMYDSVKERTEAGPSLNLATPLLAGIESALGSWPPVAGVGVTDGMQWNPTPLFFNDELTHNHAMALALHGGGVRMDTIIMHGCEPASDYHKITKAEGNVVYEIDGIPALDAVAKMLGPDAERSWEDYPLFVTLGVNQGDKWGEFNETDYANRLVMAVDKEKGALVMFEPDLAEGSDVQLMRRSIDFSYVEDRSRQILDSLGDRKPVLALYIDCLARASAYCGSEGEEAEQMTKIIGEKVPVLGTYSGVEIAKVGESVRALDWTGVLAVFSVPA